MEAEELVGDCMRRTQPELLADTTPYAFIPTRDYGCPDTLRPQLHRKIRKSSNLVQEFDRFTDEYLHKARN